MIQIIKAINLTIYFLLEVGMLVVLSYFGFQNSRHTVGKYILAIGLPLLVAILWGIFAAPRSAHRLDLPYRALFALTLFGITTFSLYLNNHTRLAITFGITALISQSLTLLLKQ